MRDVGKSVERIRDAVIAVKNPGIDVILFEKGFLVGIRGGAGNFPAAGRQLHREKTGGISESEAENFVVLQKGLYNVMRGGHRGAFSVKSRDFGSGGAARIRE